MLNRNNKINGFWTNIKISHKSTRAILFLTVLVAGVVLSLMRYATRDETGFLIETATMADCIRNGVWFGNEAVGWHGFIFKIPAAILFAIFGRSVFLATLTNVIFAALVCWLCFDFLRKLLKSTAWAFAGTWLVITTYHFILSVPTFLRDIPAMLTVLLLLFAIINKHNKWIIGLCLLLILDAKEGVFFALVPGFILWVVISELCSHREPRSENRGPNYQLRTTNYQLPTSKAQSTNYQLPTSKAQSTKYKAQKAFERIFAGLFPAFVFLVLMFCTSVVPLNMIDATILGFTKSGMHDMKFNFSPKRATRSIKKYIKPTSAIQNPRTEIRCPRSAIQNPRSAIHPRHTRGVYASLKSVNLCPCFFVRESLSVIRNPRSEKPKLGNYEDTNNSPFLKGARGIFPFYLVVESSELRLELKPNTEYRRTRHAGITSSYIDSALSAYSKKILFPRTFSFIASPKIIVIPALFMSFIMFRQFWKQGKPELTALPILLWSYMIIYIIRESHGRYLMPILPLLALFYAFFMIKGLKMRWFPVIVLAICALMIGFGFKYEIKFINVKICFNLILLSLSILALIGCRNHWKHAKIFALAVPLFTGIFATGTAIAGSITLKNGQIGNFLKFGYNMETKKIVAKFKNVEKFWLNGFVSGYVIQFYMNEKLTQGERTWRLANWVPKKHLLHKYNGNNLHRRTGMRIRSMNKFRKKIMTNNVTKIGLVISTYPNRKFPYQNKLDDLYKANWIEFKQKINLKNKTLYIFNVK